MPETPKAKTETDEKHDADAAWAEDQTRREYYYDDTHGYEIFSDTEEDELSAKITPEPGGIDEK
ncbi:MAG: hypothetical protein ACRD43_05040 [Pyrinomonadaceae bacterium]